MKGMAKDVGEMPGDVRKEVTPIELAYESMLGAKGGRDPVIHLSDRNRSKLIMWSE
jgi:hypothetical protein